MLHLEANFICVCAEIFLWKHLGGGQIVKGWIVLGNELSKDNNLGKNSREMWGWMNYLWMNLISMMFSSLTKVCVYHLGHPRVTVARQSDLALFALGLILAKSTSLAVQRKVANHSPRTPPPPRGKQTSGKAIRSGGFLFLSNTFTHLHRGHFRYACTWRFGLLPDRVLK
jgi:hypothetical protein